jgi:DNA-binding NarL/FixJ family response regulator
MNSKKKILVASRHSMVVHGLKLMLNASTPHAVVGDSRPLSHIGAMLETHCPDVVIADVDEQSTGLDQLQLWFAPGRQDAKLLLLWGSSDDNSGFWRSPASDSRFLALAAAAAMIIPSHLNGVDVLRAINQFVADVGASTAAPAMLARGWANPNHEQPQAAGRAAHVPGERQLDVSRVVPNTDSTTLAHEHTEGPPMPGPLGDITPREKQVMELIGQGCCNKKIAKALNISVTTVRTHRQKLMAKLGLHNAVEVARFATGVSAADLESAGIREFRGRTTLPASEECLI